MAASTASDAYADWVAEWVARGFSPYIITFMFDPLPGSAAACLSQMAQLIDRAYAAYVHRVVRRPFSPSWHHLVPIWLLAPDLPVHKDHKQSLRDIRINEGRHVQGFALEPIVRRTKTTIIEHFADQRRFYQRHCAGLERVHLQPITYDLETVAEYLFKSIHRGHFTDDDIIIQPKHKSELRDGPRLRGNSSIFGSN